MRAYFEDHIVNRANPIRAEAKQPPAPIIFLITLGIIQTVRHHLLST